MMKKILVVLGILAMPAIIFAQVMSSGSYEIESDSINFGGGFSSSTNYVQESTFGEIATGESGSANYNLYAGYQQMQEVYLAISAAADVTLSPSIDGTTGGTANGSTTVTVTTDNALGYSLYIRASSSPALTSGANSFSDYSPAGADPDFTFSILASDSEFGFSPEGAHVAQEYLDNGTTCNTGALESNDSCWRGLTTTDELIAESSVPNHPNGTDTVIEFRAQVGASSVQPAGTYQATTTLTVIAL